MTQDVKVNWGVLGSGGIARRRTIPEGIVPAANARLVAVFDTDSSASAEVAARFGVRAVASAAELLAADLDAVYVATPPDGHCAQVQACACARKHVLCEKPLGLTVGEAEAMIAACHQAGVRLGTAFMMRFQAQHQAALELIRNGQLGQPVFARAQLSCWYPPMPGAWRQDPARGGGGSLIDMGGHCIDLLEMFFGPVAAVSCFTNRTVHRYASEDSAVVSLRFANGALGVVDAFFCVPDEASQNRLELYGSAGSILARGTIGQGASGEMFACLAAGDTKYDAHQGRQAVGGVPIAPAPVNPYRAEIEEFSQAILDGREPANHAHLGLQSQRGLAACYEAARTGQVIELTSPKP
jgi:predicted dehydrogenase